MLVEDEQEMMQLGRKLAAQFHIGDTVLLDGPLGAGKTTLARGILAALGYKGPVRSPTFNLIQTFATDPPVMHADLYRLHSVEGTGIEDYLDSHVCLVEWPDRAPHFFEHEKCWHVSISFHRKGRFVRVAPPALSS